MDTGATMMLKALGFNPDELKGTVEGFMDHMKQQAATINANQARLEAKQDATTEELGKLCELVADLAGPRPTTRAILENGEETGVLITSEKFPQAMIDDVNRSATGPENN